MRNAGASARLQDEQVAHDPQADQAAARRQEDDEAQEQEEAQADAPPYAAMQQHAMTQDLAPPEDVEQRAATAEPEAESPAKVVRDTSPEAAASEVAKPESVGPGSPATIIEETPHADSEHAATEAGSEAADEPAAEEDETHDDGAEGRATAGAGGTPVADGGLRSNEAGADADGAAEAGPAGDAQVESDVAKAPAPMARPRASAEPVADAQTHLDASLAAERGIVTSHFAAQRGEVEATGTAQEAVVQSTAIGGHARLLAELDQREQTGRGVFAAARSSLSAFVSSQSALALGEATQATQRLRDDGVRQRQAVDQAAAGAGHRMMEGGRAAGRRIVHSARTTATAVQAQVDEAVASADAIDDAGDREAVKRTLRGVKTSTRDRLLDNGLADHDRLVGVGAQNRDRIASAAAKANAGQANASAELEATIAETGARLAAKFDAMLRARLAAVDQLEREFIAGVRRLKLGARDWLDAGARAAHQIKVQRQRQQASLHGRERTAIVQLDRAGDAAHARLADRPELSAAEAQGFTHDAAARIADARQGHLAQADAAHAQEHGALASASTRLAVLLDARRGAMTGQVDAALTQIGAVLAEASQELQTQVGADRASASTLYNGALAQANGAGWGAVGQLQAGWETQVAEIETKVAARADEQVARHGRLVVAMPARLDAVSADVVADRDRSWLGRKLSGAWSAFKAFAMGLVTAVLLVGLLVLVAILMFGTAIAATALAAALIAFLAASFVMALWHRGSSLTDAWDDWPWYRKATGVLRALVAAVGDVVGITGVVEGWYQQDFVTGRALSDEEASERFWIGVFSLFTAGLIHYFTKPGAGPAEKPGVAEGEARPPGWLEERMMREDLRNPVEEGFDRGEATEPGKTVDAAKGLTEPPSPEAYDGLARKYDIAPDVMAELKAHRVDPELADSAIAHGAQPADVALVASTYGADAVAALDGLVRGGVQPRVATEVLQIGADTGTLPDVIDLARSGRLDNPGGFRRFLKDMKKELATGLKGRRNELHEAAERARSGNRVSLGGRERVVGDPESGQADIVDYSAKEAVQVKTVESADVRAVQARAYEAVQQLRGEGGENPPIGFERTVDVRVQNPRNPLFAADRATIAEQLRGTLGLEPGDADITIRLENANGESPFVFAATELM